ncbi:MAG: NAD(P)H-binding protein [Afipia sp.]|nr:NAD(P)H-binding protein [Afipia sp.]
MTYDRPILVTGAAGQVGAVGRSITEILLDRGFKVRAMVRTNDDRAEALRVRGAEIVVGDLLDLKSIHAAIEGCERVYFGMSITSTYLEAAVNMAAVARHHGVKALVNMSQLTVAEMSVHETTTSPQQKQHWLSEQIFSWSGLPVVEVRPTVFLDAFFLRLAAPAVSTQNKLMLPFGGGKTSPIAAFDAARVIAEILADPAPHIGKVYALTGPVSQDLNGVAKEFTEALKRPITYVPVPVESFKERFAAMGLPPHLATHLTTMCLLHQANRYDRYSDDVRQITGAPAMSVRQFVERNAATFNSVAAS